MYIFAYFISDLKYVYIPCKSFVKIAKPEFFHCKQLNPVLYTEEAE